MKKILIIAFISTMMLGMAACSNSDDTTTTTPTTTTASKTDLLTAKNWKVTGLTIDGKDSYSLIDACDADDLHIFKKGGVYNADNGATKCDPADDQIYIIDTWAFSDNDTKLTFDGDVFTVNELTATKMILTGTFAGSTIVTTFTAQ